MSAPEKIKKGLECCTTAGANCGVCPYEGECVLPFGNYPESDALAYIQQLEAAVPKWISVEEMLPEKSGKYIVCTTKKSVYCTRFETHHSGGDFMTDINTHVTHWMPLPQAPKEDA